jgi:hypothetical protein
MRNFEKEKKPNHRIAFDWPGCFALDCREIAEAAAL